MILQVSTPFKRDEQTLWNIPKKNRVVMWLVQSKDNGNKWWLSVLIRTVDHILHLYFRDGCGVNQIIHNMAWYSAGISVHMNDIMMCFNRHIHTSSISVHICFLKNTANNYSKTNLHIHITRSLPTFSTKIKKHHQFLGGSWTLRVYQLSIQW